MGWGAHYFRDDTPRDFAEYYEGVTATTGPVRWFHDAPEGSLVWFRDFRAATA